MHQNPHSLALITLIRFTSSFIILMVPTTLMGATLPIIVKSSLLQAEGLGERVSFLYATNTVGAIVGTLLAGFYLIGKVGMGASFQLAAALNVVVGITAMFLAVVFRRNQTQRATRSNVASVPAPAPPVSEKRPGVEGGPIDVAITEKTRKLALLIFVFSGFISLALEVIWFRVLILFLQVTTYAFTMMLATFLLGIATGSYLVTPLMRRRMNWLATLAYTELAMGIAPLLSLGVMAGFYNGVASAEALAGHPFLREAVLIIAVSFVAIFPTTVLMGIAFPIGLRLWVAGNGDAAPHIGERIGVFYSLNVFGAIIGSIIAGFLLLTWLGSRASLIAVAAISLISGLLLLPAVPRKRHNLLQGVGIAGVIVFLVAALVVPDPLSLMLTGRYPGEQLLWREEGVQTTVSIHQQSGGTRIMYMDGLHQANDSAAMIAIHSQLAHLPLLIHPDPKEALVIGLGGGITAGEISKYPGINLDIVELSDTVLKGSDWTS
jgi:spermidine synthase